MNVICFGDSNTYGYDPRSWLGGRYDADSRWVDILAVETGWTVRNMGVHGREIPTTAPAFPEDTDLLIVMLGSNDLLQGHSPEEVAGELERFLSSLSLPRDQILLIATPPMRRGEWVPSQQLIDDSRTFAQCCRNLAEQLGSALLTPGTGTSPWHTTAYTSRSRATGPLPPDFWRYSDETDDTCAAISSATGRMWRR